MKNFAKRCIKSVVVTSLLTISGLSFTSVFNAMKNTDGMNQSILVFDNGQVTVTKSYFDNENSIRDAEHLFLLPKNVEEIHGNYMIDDAGTIYTVDTNGFIYEKPYIYMDSSIKHFGGNYMVTRKGQLWVVKSNGIIVENYGPQDEDLSRLKVVGGNFFITHSKKLFVIDSNGFYAEKTELLPEDFRPGKVDIVGYNYFITKDGEVYTFGTDYLYKMNGNDIVYDENGRPEPLLDANGNKQYFGVGYKIDAKFEEVKKVGGNYFFDKFNNIHTISVNGIFDRGANNRQLKVDSSNDKNRAYQSAEHFGSNYFIYGDGAMYMVDRDGVYHFVKTLERRAAKTNYENKLNKK